MFSLLVVNDEIIKGSYCLVNCQEKSLKIYISLDFYHREA